MYRLSERKCLGQNLYSHEVREWGRILILNGIEPVNMSLFLKQSTEFESGMELSRSSLNTITEVSGCSAGWGLGRSQNRLGKVVVI